MSILDYRPPTRPRVTPWAITSLLSGILSTPLFLTCDIFIILLFHPPIQTARFFLFLCTFSALALTLLISVRAVNQIDAARPPRGKPLILIGLLLNFCWLLFTGFLLLIAPL